MVGIGEVKKTEVHIEEPSILEIFAKDDKKVFEIDKDGKVFWLKNGKFVQAKMDTDLSLAFIAAITIGMGYEFPTLLEKIRSGEKICR